jgi:hypothetical protein
MANRYFQLVASSSVLWHADALTVWYSLTSAYNTGTATFTLNSTDVIGIGTTWTSALNGSLITSPSGTLYMIATVNSGTYLTLTGNYVQPTQTSVAYNIGVLTVGASEPATTDNVYPSNTVPTSATLTVDVTAYCQDMDWTGAANNPSFNSSGHNINIYGNSTFINAMTIVDAGGYLKFLGTGFLKTNSLG